MLKFIQKALPWLYGAAIVLAIYVVFFMPAGTGSGPVDNSGGQTSNSEQNITEFNLYSYLNKITSARGKLTFEWNVDLENGDELTIKSTQQFETKGANSSVVGSTSYAINDDAAFFDDKTYIRDGMRYVKNATGYVKTDNILMDAGNLNLGKIESFLDIQEGVVSEDNVSCYKYVFGSACFCKYNSLQNEIWKPLS